MWRIGHNSCDCDSVGTRHLISVTPHFLRRLDKTYTSATALPALRRTGVLTWFRGHIEPVVALLAILAVFAREPILSRRRAGPVREYHDPAHAINRTGGRTLGRENRAAGVYSVDSGCQTRSESSDRVMYGPVYGLAHGEESTAYI